MINNQSRRLCRCVAKLPKEQPSVREQALEEALNHLGDVLNQLADLHPDYRCRALDEALAFYNDKCPDQRVLPSGLSLQRLINIDDPLDTAPTPPMTIDGPETERWCAEAWKEREEIERQLYEGELSTRDFMLPKFIRIMHELELTQELYKTLTAAFHPAPDDSGQKKT